MPTDRLHGPYRLDPDTIEQMILRVSPGVFALGTDRGATFHVAGIGRADDDVAAILKSRVGTYVDFKFRYVDSAREAFELQCHLFHDFAPGLHQPEHPLRPAGCDWQCPRCEVFG